MTNVELSELIGIAYDTAKSKGFFCDNQSDNAYIAAIHEELSEAFRAWNKRLGWLVMDEKPDGVYFELADAVIRVFSFCGYKGIHLFEYEFETDRPYDKSDLCDVIVRSHLAIAQAAELLERDDFIDDFEEGLNMKCVSSVFSQFIARIELFVEESLDNQHAFVDLIHTKLKYNITRGMKHGGNKV